MDHTGASNAQLIKEKDPLCERYKDRSIAEQNSLDLSWELLMKPDYDELRTVLFAADSDLARFRQLVVNSVMVSALSFALSLRSKCMDS